MLRTAGSTRCKLPRFWLAAFVQSGSLSLSNHSRHLQNKLYTGQSNLSMAWPQPGLDHRWCFRLTPFLPLPSLLCAFSHEHLSDLPTLWCPPSSSPILWCLLRPLKVANSSTSIVSEGFSSQILLQVQRQNLTHPHSPLSSFHG